MILPGADSDYDLTPELIQALQLKYPAIPVQNEILLINLWLAKNPRRRPKRMLRFVETWLKRTRAKPVQLKAVGQMTEFEILTYARSKGCEPRPGESYEQLLRRARAA